VLLVLAPHDHLHIKHESASPRRLECSSLLVEIFSSSTGNWLRASMSSSALLWHSVARSIRPAVEASADHGD